MVDGKGAGVGEDVMVIEYVFDLKVSLVDEGAFVGDFAVVVVYEGAFVVVVDGAFVDEGVVVVYEGAFVVVDGAFVGEGAGEGAVSGEGAFVDDFSVVGEGVTFVKSI